MKLVMLKPRLKTMDVNRVKVLDRKAGATERIRGNTWMNIRRKVLLRDAYTCAACGIVRMDNECDHITPLELGGSNDLSNLQTLCGGPNGCHTAKSKLEARGRAR
jgi:5-methylcytosine-specific restriction protein A